MPRPNAGQGEAPTMRRAPIEIAVGIVASTLMAATVVIAAGVLPTTTALPSVQVTEQVGCWMAPVFQRDGSGVVGRARLCIVDEGVRPAIEATGLTPGIVYATWLGYFDRPTDCRKSRCTLSDFVGDEPAGVVGRMDGLVADGTGKAAFWGDFRDLRLAGGSEVRLLIFERGHTGVANSRRRCPPALDLAALVVRSTRHRLNGRS